MTFERVYRADIRLGRFLSMKYAGKGKHFKLPEGFTVTAHTGAMMTRSNSRQSICEAGLCGADVCEVDLHFRPDGTPVISHNKPKDNSSGITFDTALSYVARSQTLKLNIDIKSSAGLLQIPALLVRHGLSQRAFFTGVHGDFIKAVREVCPGIPYYLNHWSDGNLGNDGAIDAKITEIKETGAVGINMSMSDCSARLCEKLHENGLLVSVWTVNKPEDMMRILSYLPDNITTKRPMTLVSLIGR